MRGSSNVYQRKPGPGTHYVRALAVTPAPIAPREPCWRCGVRADVGCAHSRALAA